MYMYMLEANTVHVYEFPVHTIVYLICAVHHD